MTFEAMAPMIVSYIMVAVVITNTTVIVEAIIALASYVIEQVAVLSRMVVLIMIPSQALRDLEL